MSFLRDCVYPVELPAGIDPAKRPGLQIEQILVDPAFEHLESKLYHSCRKICMMGVAVQRALVAEQEFYASTIQDAPALFGEHAIELAYHLEGMIYFARSALDVAAGLFGEFLLKKRFDSFNDLSKAIAKVDRPAKENISLEPNFVLAVQEQRAASDGWFSTLCGSERGRALRDKIAHQTGFPIDYEELFVTSEKEYAVVRISAKCRIPLEAFLIDVRDGVISTFLAFEEEVVRVRKQSG